MEASTILNSPASGLSVKSQVSARAGIFSKPCASLFGSQRQSCSISFGRRNTLEPVKVAAEEVLEFSDTVDDEEDIKESRIVLYLKVNEVRLMIVHDASVAHLLLRLTDLLQARWLAN